MANGITRPRHQVRGLNPASTLLESERPISSVGINIPSGISERNLGPRGAVTQEAARSAAEGAAELAAIRQRFAQRADRDRFMEVRNQVNAELSRIEVKKQDYRGKDALGATTALTEEFNTFFEQQIEPNLHSERQRADAQILKNQTLISLSNNLSRYEMRESSRYRKEQATGNLAGSQRAAMAAAVDGGEDWPTIVKKNIADGLEVIAHVGDANGEAKELTKEKGLKWLEGVHGDVISSLAYSGRTEDAFKWLREAKKAKEVSPGAFSRLESAVRRKQERISLQLAEDEIMSRGLEESEALNLIRSSNLKGDQRKNLLDAVKARYAEQRRLEKVAADKRFQQAATAWRKSPGRHPKDVIPGWGELREKERAHLERNWRFQRGILGSKKTNRKGLNKAQRDFVLSPEKLAEIDSEEKLDRYESEIGLDPRHKDDLLRLVSRAKKSLAAQERREQLSKKDMTSITEYMVNSIGIGKGSENERLDAIVQARDVIENSGAKSIAEAKEKADEWIRAHQVRSRGFFGTDIGADTREVVEDFFLEKLPFFISTPPVKDPDRVTGELRSTVVETFKGALGRNPTPSELVRAANLLAVRRNTNDPEERAAADKELTRMVSK